MRLPTDAGLIGCPAARLGASPSFIVAFRQARIRSWMLVN
jgi:hypothetical protein